MKTFCNICRKPLDLQPGEGSNPAWDARLIRQVACNACCDFVIERNRLTDEIVRRATFWAVARTQRDQARVTRQRVALRDGLAILLRDYTRLMAKHHNAVIEDIDITVPLDLLMQNPEKAFDILREVRCVVRNHIRNAQISRQDGSEQAFNPKPVSPQHQPS